MKKLVLILFSFYLACLSFIVAAEGTYTLQPGDVLEISVWKEMDLQRDVLVRPDGGISFPLVGNIDTTGMSIEQMTKEVTARIEKYIPDPVVTVSLKQMIGNRIYILGKVNKPGVYPVVRNVDVLQALSMAGGMNPFADGDKIQILRRNGEKQISIPFDYDAVEDGDLAQNIVLQPGDVVLVP
jgi:polysaccharide export outer membrane protein